MTADGRKLVYTRSTGSANLWLAATDRAEKGARFITTQLTRGTTSKKPPRPSPDGRWLAFVQEQDNRPNIFTLPIDGGEPRQITFTGAAYSIPVWSPDGRGLAFCANVGGVIKVRTVDVGSGRERTYERTEAGPGCQLAWGPGRRILYQRPGNRNFHLLDPATEAEAPLVANDSVGWMFYPVYSPDGERVAVAWNRHPHGVWVIALKDSSQVLVHGGRSGPVGWSADGRSVYVEDGTSGDILRVSATGGAATTVAKQPFDNADCAAIERRSSLALVCWVEESIADAWMIENFDPDLR
jgi:Tol biopolymer transport system component